MARRSSARLRSRNSTTPKRVSLSHDAPGRTPKTVPARLASLEENDEMPGSFPASPTGIPTRAAKRINTGRQATPKDVTPIRPTDEEMHPQKHHQTTTKPLEEARHLGFSNMGACTAPPKQTSRIATLQATPTRTQNPAEDAKSPTFQFTFRREHSLELSPDAKRLMLEKREEAARIREQMIASGEDAKDGLGNAARSKGMQKGKSGRFSGVHREQFNKMDSIASHPSAYRAAPAPVAQKEASLKRSPSKAQLDEQALAAKVLHRSPSKPSLLQPGSPLPRAKSAHNLATTVDTSSSPTKRVKRTENDDVSATRPPSSDSDQPSTPQQHKTLRMHPSNPNLSGITTPTQASLARAASVKPATTSKIPGLHLARSPSKPMLVETNVTDASTTPLLARSPSKAAMFSSPKRQPLDDEDDPSSPLLTRSPLKPAPSKKPAAGQNGEVTESIAAPLLARSPLKSAPSAKPSTLQNSEGTKPTAALLLARSPLKMSVNKHADTEVQTERQPTVPLLARSPSKIALPTNPVATQVSASPGKGPGLMSRFNLLRSSPMKSILRSPARLYSDDPAKVAAGTHFATPPKITHSINSLLHSRSGTPTASVQKRVDFSSSTKARYEAKSASSTPSRDPTPPPKDTVSDGKPMDVEYPSLPSPAAIASPSPQKRRQTVAPGDFTFRAGSYGIVFGQSPNAAAGTGKNKRPSIRHVSAEPEIIPKVVEAPPTAQGSKKRKFEFENDVALPDIAMGGVSDKENTPALQEEDEARPAKRAKSNPSEAKSAASTSPTKLAGNRLPTLGVKPKGSKAAVSGKEKEKKGRPSTISQARLAALAMPKKRG